jgi:Fic family protein
MKKPERVPVVPKNFNYAKFLAGLDPEQFSRVFELNDTKYPYYDKWKYLAEEWGMDPQQLWAGVKTARIGQKSLVISRIPGFGFKINSPAVVQEYLHAFDMNLGGNLQGDTVIPSEDRDRYLISSLMEEAIASSQLEGAATTRKVAREMLENNRKPRNHSEQMILNNYEAMKWIVAHKEEPFTTDRIKTLQAIITKDTLHGEEPGTFRTTDDFNVADVQTGAVLYTPPAAGQLEELMTALCNFANDEQKLSFFLHPINKGIIVHFLMGYIHPFPDGNGRTARTLFYWYLLKHGYWLIEYMSVSRIILHSKAQYAKAYLHTEQDDNDLTYFIIYNLRSIARSLDELRQYIKRKTAEKQNALTLLRHTNFNERQIILLQELMQDPTLFFTVLQVQNRFGVSNQTARNDLNGLTEQGIFEERRTGHRIQFLPRPDFKKKIQRK